jgi:hypothetical protein
MGGADAADDKAPAHVADDPHFQPSAVDHATLYLKFNYAELKDFAKQFLTVVAGVLTLTITFSEKIVNFATATPATRNYMILVWSLCLFAVVSGGGAVFMMYNAGAIAKSTILHRRTMYPRTFRALDLAAHWGMNLAGLAFTLALVVLAVVAIRNAGPASPAAPVVLIDE